MVSAVPANFSSKKLENKYCCPCGETEEMEHMYNCKYWNNEESKPEYKMIYEDNLKHQMNVSERFRIILDNFHSSRKVKSQKIFLLQI